MKTKDTIKLKIRDDLVSPAYSRVADFLRDNIRSGKFVHGNKLPPEPELARQFGISRVTLRHALKNLEQQGLLLRRRGWSGGNFVNFPRNKSVAPKTIGLINRLMHPDKDPYFLQLMDGFRAGLGDNMNLLLLKETDADVVELYHNCRLDGVLITDPCSALECSNDLTTIPHVIVSVSSAFIGNKNLVSVDTDNISGTLSIMEHLTGLGHKRIAYIGGDPKSSNLQDRLSSYKKFLKQAGIAIDPHLIYDNPSQDYEAYIYSSIKKLLTLRYPPTAIFAAGFYLAMATIRDLRDYGLLVPEDISVVGFDDFDRFTYHPPFLTTVRQPLKKLGFEAGRKLVEWINTGTVREKQLVLPVEFLIRSSSSAPGANFQNKIQKKINRFEKANAFSEVITPV
ncbi:MAG: GntR family transcriptional regulator [Victivallales bacterium]